MQKNSEVGHSLHTQVGWRSCVQLLEPRGCPACDQQCLGTAPWLLGTAQSSRWWSWELLLQTQQGHALLSTALGLFDAQAPGVERKTYFSAMNIMWDAAAAMGHGQHAQLSFSGDGSPPRLFPTFPFNLLDFLFVLFSLLSLFFFSFFLLYSLLLGSSFLLCHNQTKPDSQEQLLALWAAHVQQYHGLTMLAGTEFLPEGRIGAGA